MWRLRRRQDLPPEAFWGTEELRALVEKLGSAWGGLFVVLSYRWLSKEHPDPDAFHLGIVASVMRAYLDARKMFDKHTSPLAKSFAKAGLDAPDCAIFWDFACLYQEPRVDKETILFKAGLRASNIWYGHQETLVWLQPELPAAFRFEADLAQTYNDSGWCFVEAVVSATIKAASCRLDLSKRGAAQQWVGLGTEDNYMAHNCQAQRLPPQLPDQVQRALEAEKTFTADSDVAVVESIYRSFFRHAAPLLKEFVLPRLAGWGPAEVMQLCTVLPHFANCQSLDLSENQIGDFGAQAVATALQAPRAAVAKLRLYGCGIGPAGGLELARALRANRTLTVLDLTRNCVGAEGGQALAEALEDNTALTQLDLGVNSLSGRSLTEAFARALRANTALAQLDLRGNELGAEGGCALAGALKTNSTLTQLDLYGNSLGNEGGRELAEALRANKALIQLDLGRNRFDVDGGWALAEALGANTTLTALDLRDNGLTGQVGKAVAAALESNTALVQLGLRSNSLGSKAISEIKAAAQRRAKPLELSV